MKFLKYSLLFLIFLIFIAVIYEPLSFKPSQSLSTLEELKGAIHVHSNLSDGRLPPEKIAESAKKSGLDFVVLTDHGNPNLNVIEKEGMINGVSIISGSELSLFEGSLLAVGVEKPTYKISSVAEEAIDDIKELGGVSILAHPEKNKKGWKELELENIDGMEIIDLDDEIRKGGILRIVRTLLTYPINSRYSIVSLIERPSEQIEIWEKNLKNQKISSIYGLNLHGKIGIFPFSYSKIFNIAKIHIPIDGKKTEKFEDVKRLVMEALKNGNFFSSIDGAGDSRGFRFYALSNGRRVEMGGIAERGSYLHIELPFKTEFEGVFFKDGKKIFSTEKRRALIKIDKNGIYRVEVYLKKSSALKKNVPWIISNPIFFGEREKESKEEIKWEKFPIFNLKKLLPENDESSEGNSVFSGDFLLWNYRLGFSSPLKPHVWCALALREEFSLEGFKGIGIEGKASPSVRLWLQIRDKEMGEERWWSASLKIKEELREKFFRWEDFKLTKGKGWKLKLENLVGFFLIIDKGSMWEGSRGEIKIKSIFAIK